MHRMIGQGGWADGETGEVIVPPGLPLKYQSVIHAAMIACAGFTTRRSVELQDGAYRRRAVEKQRLLRAATDDLAAFLEAAWGWCDRNQEHPKLAEREDEVLDALRSYEAMSNALAVAGQAIAADEARWA